MGKCMISEGETVDWRCASKTCRRCGFWDETAEKRKKIKLQKGADGLFRKFLRGKNHERIDL